MSVFDKWNKNVNKEFMSELDAQERGEGGNYENPPFGTYEVKIERMELKESKKGDPMFQALFKILTGEQKGKTILMNQVVLQPFQIHICNDFLRSLDTDVDVKFKNYTQYSDLILDVMESVEKDGLEFALEFGENDKGFNTYEITDVFEK